MAEVESVEKTLTLLPIGSVVTLRNTGSKTVMIYSRMIVTTEGEIWDYLLCPYPEGYINDDTSLLANRNDITGLVFIGYQTERESNMREVLLSTPRGEASDWDWTEY